MTILPFLQYITGSMGPKCTDVLQQVEYWGAGCTLSRVLSSALLGTLSSMLDALPNHQSSTARASMPCMLLLLCGDSS